MKNLWRLLKLMRPWAGWMALGVLLSLITLFANVALMAVSGWFIASMALAGIAGVSMNYFSPGAIIRGAAILRTAGRYGERLVTHEATFRLIASVRLWFFQRLEPLAPAGIEDMRSGDLLSRLRADIDALDNFYLRIVLPLVVAVIGVVVTVWVMSWYGAELAWVLLVGLLLAGVALPALTARLGRRPGQILIERSSECRGQIVDHVQGLAELSVFGALDQHAGTIHQASQDWISAQQRMGRIAGLSQSGLLLFTNLALWLVMLLAVPMVVSGALEPAELAMLALFTVAAFESVMPLPDALRLLGQVSLAAERLFALVDRPLPVTEPAPEYAAAPPPDFALELQSVSLRYAGSDRLALEDISLTLNAGARVAIVGASGAGKSSLVQLLLRQREFEAGEIRLGGRSLRDYRGEQLREWIALAPQNVHLFSASIRDNLRLAKADASDAELDAVCRVAQLDEFIHAQPDGYTTWVGETGVNLSGGQARRLAVARALLRDPQWLILDEPGEGLDNHTQRLLIEAILADSAERGLIMITHSDVGLAQMDEVIVLEQGRVRARGPYQALVEQGVLARMASTD